MILAPLVLLLQATQPSIGDTIWIARPLGEVRGAIVRPQPWPLEPIGIQLGPAEVSHGAGGATVRYPVIVWYPGDRVLTMPGPVLVRPDGTSDTLPPSSHRLRVESVLTAGEPRARLAPRPARSPLPLAARSAIPLIRLAGAVLLAIGVAALLWRRRGRPGTRPSPAMPEPSGETLERWVRAGEHRAALTRWGWKLSRRMQRSSDLTEIGELQMLLQEIATSAFVPRRPDQLTALSDRAARAGAT